MVKNNFVNGTFAVIVGDWFSNGVQHSMPWLIAMTLVVVVELYLITKLQNLKAIHNSTRTNTRTAYVVSNYKI